MVLLGWLGEECHLLLRRNPFGEAGDLSTTVYTLDHGFSALEAVSCCMLSVVLCGWNTIRVGPLVGNRAAVRCCGLGRAVHELTGQHVGCQGGL
jgi:hypothetical protein